MYFIGHGNIRSNGPRLSRNSILAIRKQFNCEDLDDLDAPALEMEYLQSNFSFVVILPNNRTELTELEKRIENYDLSKIFDRMSVRMANILIPRFKLETEINLNVKYFEKSMFAVSIVQ